MKKDQKKNIISKTFHNFIIKPIKLGLIEELEKINNQSVEQINSNIEKQLSSINERENASIDSKLKQFNVNPNYFNSVARPNIKDKPEGYINPLVLRNFSIDYPIARACIDFIKSKLTQLDWEIVKENEEDTLINDDLIRKNIEDFFAKPSGQNSSMRILLESIVEDYLVLGSVSLEKLRTRGGKLFELLPVDSATIKVRINENGRIPKSPDIAFEQWIMGSKVAELTQDDLLFSVKNARPNTIFGLSPLESLVIQVQSALAGSLYNWRFFTDSNQAEGFIEVPEEWTKDQIQEFQAYFDSMMSGDPRYQRKLKMMPSGMKYTPTKKPDDMAFERFELWLLQQTCAVFGVTPQSLGFTQQVNKATAEVQGDITQERVGRALQQFIEEMFTNLIQYDMGYSDYKFTFVNVDPTDLLEEAQIEDIRIRNGTLSIDEVRRKNGLEQIGAKHFIMTSSGPLLISEGFEKPETNEPETEMEEPEMEEIDEQEKDDPEETENEMERKEFSQWKKYCINSIKKGKDFKDFKTYKIDEETSKEVKTQLLEAETKADIVEIFKPYINGDYKTINKLKRLLNEIDKIENS